MTSFLKRSLRCTDMGSRLGLLAAFKRYLLLHALHRCFFTRNTCIHNYTQSKSLTYLQYIFLVYIIWPECCMFICKCPLCVIHLESNQRLGSAVSEVAVAHVCGQAQLKCVFVQGQESTCSFTPRVSMWTCWSAVKFQTWRRM